MSNSLGTVGIPLGASFPKLEAMAKIIVRSLLALLAIYLLGKLFLGNNGLLRQFRITRENAEISLSIDSLEQVLQNKKEERRRLLHDTLYMEEIARTRFGMSRRGESVFQFLPPQDSRRNDNTQPPTASDESK